jgi:hypothetical protein
MIQQRTYIRELIRNRAWILLANRKALSNSKAQLDIDSAIEEVWQPVGNQTSQLCVPLVNQISQLESDQAEIALNKILLYLDLKDEMLSARLYNDFC